MEATGVGSGDTAVFDMDLFTSYSNYSITWKQNYTLGGESRNGFLLRGTAATISSYDGLMKGYYFQINSSKGGRGSREAGIYRVTDSGPGDPIIKVNHTPTGRNTDRWYRATANGSTLTLLVSTDGNVFTTLISIDDDTYTSGKTQYVIGFGDGIGGMYVDDITLQDSDNTTWNGGTSSAWQDAANWTGGIPSINSNVTIANAGIAPILTSSASINSIIINATASLTATGSSAQLSTIANFVNNGTVMFNSSSSLIVGGTSTGKITYNRSIASTNWHLISSPVIGQGIDAFSLAEDLALGTNNNRGLSDYNYNTSAWNYYQNEATGSGNFISGDARSLKLSATGDISFTGTIPIANVSIAINTNVNGFNLIGNPYPCYMAVNSSTGGINNLLTVNDIDTNRLTEATIWLWNQANNSYQAINQASSATYISPGQGFFVSANGSHNFSFTEAMQSHQATDSFQRAAVTTRPEIKLFIANGSVTKNTDLYYIAGTTTGFDNGYDSSFFSTGDTSFSIYTHLVSDSKGEAYQIQSLPDSDFESMVIPIGVNAIAGSAINITANSVNFPQGIQTYLEDKEDNSFTLLENDAVFTTTLSSNLNGIGRFYLHTTTNTLGTNNVVLDHLSIYLSNRNNLRIVGVQNETASARIFNIPGKQLVNTSFKGNSVNNITLPNLTSGIYIVQLVTQKGTLNKKITIQE